MPLRIKCPSGHSLIVSESRAGQTFRCPKCQGEVRVPGGSPTKPPPPVAVRPSEEKQPAAKQQAIEKPVVKPPVINQPPVQSPPSPTQPLPRPVPALVPQAKEIKEAQPPPVVLQVQVALEKPATPVPAATQEPTAPPPIPQVTSPAVEPVAPPVIVSAPRDKASLMQSMLVGSPMFAEGTVQIEQRLAPSPRASETNLPDPAKAIASGAAGPPDVAPQPVSIPATSHFPSPPLATELPPPLVHSPRQVAVVFQLAATMIVAAVFSVFPSAWDLFDYASGTSAAPLGRWAIVLGMLGAVQVAYAIYLIQLPDWTTVWMATLFALASAALYAMALGLTIISGEDGWLVRFLQLSDKVVGGKAALWCLCMMSVMTLLAFFAGRISVRWRQAEAVLREAA